MECDEMKFYPAYCRYSLLAGIMLLVLFIPLVSSAQFQVHSWNHFDTGSFPNDLMRMHDADEGNVVVYDYMSPGAPQEILDGLARSECRRYGLQLTPSGEKRFLKCVNNSTLNRQDLGLSGKALYQADFFLPATNKDIPYSMAVLAVHDTGNLGDKQFSFYRFGVLKGERVFFSYTKQTPEPIIYKQMNISEMQLRRPGWHRFQIVFNGQQEIICAVDGIPTNFSPLSEGTLDKLRAGIMVSEQAEGSGTCYIDNLSIQWTQANLQLPESPWLMAYRPTPGYTAPGQTQQFGQPSGTESRFSWFTATETAWQKCLETKKPVVALLYTPKSSAWQTLSKSLAENSELQKALSNYIPLKLDANQLNGGVVVTRYKIFKVPCFLVVTPQSQEKGRLYITGKTTTQQILVWLQSMSQAQ
jgi:hypothetical protein